MSQGRGPLVVTRTVQQLLFDGYDDPLLTLIRANGNPDIPKVSKNEFSDIFRCFKVLNFRSRRSTSSAGSSTETSQRLTTVTSRCSPAPTTSASWACFNCGTTRRRRITIEDVATMFSGRPASFGRRSKTG